MHFQTIDLDRDRELFLTFYRSLHRDASGKELLDLDEQELIERLRPRVEQFPDGYVFVMIEGQPVGYMGLQVKSYEERPIGYMSNIYLLPDYRGQGVSQEMFAYAERFFRARSVDEYHLRVDVGNSRAQRFYEKQELTRIAAEPNSSGNPCYRMSKQL